MKDTFFLNISTADNLGIGLFKYSIYPEEKFIIINSCLPKILGFSSKNEFKKESLSGLFLNPENKDALYNQLKLNNRVKFFEAQFKTKSGANIWAAVTASRIVSRGKEYIEGIIEDISSHRQIEEQLALERDYLQSLLDNIPDAIYFKDTQNRIIKVNKFYLDGMKRPLNGIIGKTDFDFFPEDQAQRMFEDDNYVLNSGKPIIGKIERTILPSGTWNQVITTKIPMSNSQGKIIGTMGITRDMTAYANLEQERLNMIITSLEVLGKALELRDPYTFSHMRRVAEIASKIAGVLEWEADRILCLKLAGELHDLGKIGIPLDILNKPGKLSEAEYSLVQQHVQNSYDLIKHISFPFSLAKTIYQHHERLDGSGYPQKLRAEEILTEAKILAVSDVLEAMTCYRPYREALGIEKAKDELVSQRGIKYDSQIVGIAVELIHKNNGQAFWNLN